MPTSPPEPSPSEVSAIESPQTRRPALALTSLAPWVLFVVAFGLRLVGIGWGLPTEGRDWSYHPDEPVNFAYSQQIEPARLDLDPGFYNYGTLYLTALRIAGDMAATYGGAPDPKDWASVRRHMANTHLAGRVMSALAGAGTAVVAFLLTIRFAGLFGATMAGLLVAFAPGFVVHSRFQTVDATAAFLLAVSTLFALRTLPRTDAEPPPLPKDALLAGLFAGLSAGTKYNGGLVILTLYAALYLGRRPGWAKAAGLGTLAALGGFLVSTPGVLINTRKFIEDFTYEVRHSQEGHGLVFVGTSSGFAFHLGNLFVGVGVVLTILGLAGLFLAGWRRHAWALALLAFFVPYYLLIGRAEVKFLRYTFPLLVGTAAGFGWLMAKGRERGGWGHAVVAGGFLGLGGVLDPGGLRGAALMSSWMTGEDPRDAAARYLKGIAQTRPETTIGLVDDAWYYTPPLYPEVGAPRAVPITARLEAMANATAPRVVQYVPPDPSARANFDERLLTELRPDYLVYSSFEEGDLGRIERMQPVPEPVRPLIDRVRAFAAQRDRAYVFDRAFYAPSGLPHDLEYIRPVIWVWKRKDLPNSPTP